MGKSGSGAGGGGIYFFGFIGAAIYFIGNAPTFGSGFIGFLKAIVWPGFLVHGLLQFLKL